jgi:hypothetical protein
MAAGWRHDTVSEEGLMLVTQKDGDTRPARVEPRPAEVNPIRDRATFDAARAACRADPGGFHGDMARRNLHWFVRDLGARGAWITFDPATETWSGWDAATAGSSFAFRTVDARVR